MAFDKKIGHYRCGLFDSRDEHDACGVGFVANVHGERSTMVIEQANTMLNRMEHRGACGCDDETGDGAGVMTGIPYELYERFAKEAGVTLPPLGEFAVGMFFINEKDRVEEAMHRFAEYAEECEMRVLFWRKADVNNLQIGPVAAFAEPITIQVFVVPNGKEEDFKNTKFVCKVFFLRKYASHKFETDEIAYICSLSPNTVVYKGMFTSRQLWDYFEDLQSSDFKTHFAIVHNRFSTNTFPSWSRAHPQRMMAHNGEINTLRGNVNYARARQALMESTRFGERLKQLFPIIESGMSDSGCFDNLLEFLCYCSTRSLPEVVISMIPEAWQADEAMPQHKRVFYKWAASLLEPWDGPALVVFSDGRYIGAILDRNGLRPARYYTTTDGMIYMSSEVGVVDLPDVVGVKAKSRLKPGRLLIVDTQAGELLNDEQLKQDIASRYPIFEWIREGAIDLEQLHEARGPIDAAEVAAFSLHATTEITGDCHGGGATTTGLLTHDPRLTLFGFTPENMSMLLLPMLINQKEALGSMGNDIPLACLSEYDPLIYEYFKQLFAQVTNPPIDPFREGIVMSLACPIGPEANVLEPSPLQAHRLWLSQPILSLSDMLLFRSLQSPLPTTQTSASLTSHVYGWRSRLLESSFALRPGVQPVDLGGLLRGALEALCAAAEKAVRDEGVSIIIISDRRLSADTVPVPSLLAVGAVHQHLLRVELRMKVGLVVESGDAREVHHFCALLSFGADAICPYMVFEVVQGLHREGMLIPTGPDSNKSSDEAFFKNYVKAVGNGILKVMAKMGISTLQSYKAAQIFEAVGLAREVIDMCFTGTVSRIAGAGFDVLATEVCSRHSKAFGLLHTFNGTSVDSRRDCVVDGEDRVPGTGSFLRNPGFYHWRLGGEKHMNDPVTIAKLQAATRNNSSEIFRQFTESADEQARQCTLRGQFEFKFAEKPIPVDLVESATEIVKKFATGAMSLGSISAETHSALAKAMNTVGGRSNTGEGGELPDRYLNPLLSSSIKQVASARFGVNSSYLAHADMLQIKMAQGAKPGEGGELPGHKVTAEIALLRHSVPGVGLISPPPHHDIYSIEDLAQLIYDLKAANPMAVVSVKLVSEVGVGVIASGVAKAHAAHIIVSGHDGGTGASSWTGIKNAGLPWELGIAETHQVLVSNHTRSKVVLQVDGQIRTARDVVIAAILGADEFAMSTAPLIVLGCTMMRKCHLNTCPVGICTQDPVLRKKFAGVPEHLINYFFLLAEDVRQLLAQLGFTRLTDITGHTELLQQRNSPTNEKTACLDLSPLLAMPTSPFKDLIFDHRLGLPIWDSMASIDVLDAPLHCDISGITMEASPTLRLACSLPPDRHWDRRLLIAAIPLLETPCGMGGKDDDVLPVVRISGAISNEDRAFGASLSYAISMKFNEEGLPKTRRLEVNLRGHAGQSFCAFLAPGVYVSLTGDANDYVAKGLSGGKVTIVPASRLLTKNFHSEDHIIVGNACLYGAIEGRVFIRGQAAERFCVRNSGAIVVAEGCGDHGCEYMTGGRVVLLGRSGRNFAAGMSGGLAFVYDADRVFKARCNLQTVSLFDMTLENEYATWLCTIIRNFFDETGSLVARHILKHFNSEVSNFVLVFPNDYRAALMAMAADNNTIATNGPTSANGDSVAPDDEDAVAAAAAKSVVDGTKNIDIEDAQKGLAMVENGTAMERPDKLRGFVKYPRTKIKYRPVEERLRDWTEVYAHASLRHGLKTQAARCMDCGVPFCQSSFGCPLGNLIPNWNDLVHKDQWLAAHEAMIQTNNFPEFTGRVCPAPCEGACVLGIIDLPVTIKNIECAIGEFGWEHGLNVPRPLPASKVTGKRIAIVGSGPSGLACAAQLIKAGHKVVVMERRNLPGGLMRYGIPTMKLDRRVLDRRLDLMRADGVEFLCNVQVGSSSMDLNATCRPADEVVKVVPAKKLLEDFDAIVLCLGSTWPRDLNIPGRNLEGIHFAMSFLEPWQRKQSKVTESNAAATSSVEALLRNSGEFANLPTLARDKRVVVIGGGDTGVDCIATATRQGAKSVETLEIMATPPGSRDNRTNPWPEWPLIFRTDYGHEEVAVHYGRDPRTFNILTKAFVAASNDPTRLGGLSTVSVRWELPAGEDSNARPKLVEIPDTEKTIECDMALLAMGFLGPEKSILEELNLAADSWSNIKTASGKFSTSVPRVYAAGDCRRGQSLVVHAINEGRQAARQVDIDLMGNSTLPGPGGINPPKNTKVCT
ncbi:glutamate synthase [Echinococcus multilocularis]|uniref:glutamate synthase (NADH) n=1 Tax=Echinococcus multilocularis TaxID=6211 RepID=A0A068Y3C2_ECHMU|nr:glutamate synthase [Echinococcus multilocularis]